MKIECNEFCFYNAKIGLQKNTHYEEFNLIISEEDGIFDFYITLEVEQELEVKYFVGDKEFLFTGRMERLDFDFQGEVLRATLINKKTDEVVAL